MLNHSLRKTSVAGQFYSSNPQQLEIQIDSFIQNKELLKFKDKYIRAVIVPHAGYTFSGKIAAETLATADNGKYERIIILCPSHYVGFTGMALPTYDRCNTPFGELAVDVNAVKELSQTGFTSNPDAHKLEHSLEVQLPLIKKIFDNIPILPVICGYTKATEQENMIKAMYKFFDKNTLWIISSDFTHYGKSFNYLPFTNNIKENLYNLDIGAVKQILSKKSVDFEKYIQKTGATVCGAKPITILLKIIEMAIKNKQNLKGELVEYITSGDITGDFQHCVSYAGINFYDV
ncbi:MAG TPA: AmmeMemoRadiSam system protein B [Victivallales bacterium]|nr:AmmeMemoRadiSam system protein B [Victivallales bacterium]